MIYKVRVFDNHTAIGLTVDFVKIRYFEKSRRDYVRKNVARAHRRKLILVAHEYERRAVLQRLDKA